MKLKWVRAFVEFADCGNFDLAARSLDISNGQLSKYISSIEAELDTELFDRSSNKMKLNRKGERFFNIARQIIDLNDEYYMQVHNPNRKGKKVIELGCTAMMAPYNITGKIMEFQKLHPDIMVNVQNPEREHQLTDMLEVQACELAFVRGTALLDEKYEKLLYCPDRLVAVIPEDHPLAGRSSVSMKDFANENILLMPKYTVSYHEFLRRCREENVKLNVGGYFRQADTIVNMVADGLGVSFLMSTPTRRYRSAERVRLLELEPFSELNVYLARLRGLRLSEAGQMFWDYIDGHAELWL
ncbi:MAG: LysR family transcriptional regulator [Oscillospiraceae bacterium]